MRFRMVGGWNSMDPGSSFELMGRFRSLVWLAVEPEELLDSGAGMFSASMSTGTGMFSASGVLAGWGNPYAVHTLPSQNLVWLAVEPEELLDSGAGSTCPGCHMVLATG
jgi:hypothetical protein